MLAVCGLNAVVSQQNFPVIILSRPRRYVQSRRGREIKSFSGLFFFFLMTAVSAK